ncbi:MAG: hypothetical protein KBC64_04930 [Simkaniaceae bacterium]|nr:hypothetical protein [Simkaniaceae bacterium]
MNKLCLALCALISSVASAASLTIYNDSMYTLTATIFSNDGMNCGGVIVTPFHQMQWQSSFQNADNGRDVMTPLTVLLTCPNGTSFGTWLQVPTGATINALGSQGAHYCEAIKQPLKP